MEHEDCGSPTLAAAADMARHDAQLHEQLQQFRLQMAGRYRVDSLIGVSQQIVKARAQIELLLPAYGRTCSSWDQAASARITQPRRFTMASLAGTLVPLSCAVLETNLSRSTLRAAWTRISTGELSTTLLLEDIDVLAADAQADLIEMLRADLPRLRVVATSAHSLAELAAVEGLLPALVSAISTLTIELPSLAERLEDLPLLAQAFLEEANFGVARQMGGFTSACLTLLPPMPGR